MTVLIEARPNESASPAVEALFAKVPHARLVRDIGVSAIPRLDADAWIVDGDQVSAMQGSADGVQPGDAVTVQLISQDHFVAGPYKYDFQNQF